MRGRNANPKATTILRCATIFGRGRLRTLRTDFVSTPNRQRNVKLFLALICTVDSKFFKFPALPSHRPWHRSWWPVSSDAATFVRLLARCRARVVPDPSRAACTSFAGRPSQPHVPLPPASLAFPWPELAMLMATCPSSAISSRTRPRSLLSPAACPDGPCWGFVGFGRLRVAHSARELSALGPR